MINIMTIDFEIIAQELLKTEPDYVIMNRTTFEIIKNINNKVFKYSKPEHNTLATIFGVPIAICEAVYTGSIEVVSIEY